MDGLLSFFEQEVSTFCILRSDFLLPGPIVYNPRSDSFVTASSSREVQAYTYSEMAAAASMGAANNDTSTNSALTQFKKLQTSWSLSVGEAVVEIVLGRVTPNLPAGQQDIVVLGVRNLFFIKDGGTIRTIKRLDFYPVAMSLYPLPDEAVHGGAGNEGMILSSSTGGLMVYHGITLMWAAKTETVPVCISVGCFGGLPGLIAALDDTGHTALLYLGTDPPANTVVGAVQRELDYDKMDDQHRRLLNLIRDATSDQRQEPKDVVHIKAGVVDLAPGEHGGPAVQIRLSLSQPSQVPIRNISVSVTVPHGLVSSQDLMAVPTLGSTPMMMMLSFEALPYLTPPSLTPEVTACYMNDKGEPRVSQCQIELPLALVAAMVPDTKEPSIKFTLDTNQDPVYLPTLYADMQSKDDDATVMAPNMVGFQYSNGEDVKLIASKNAGRYRVQADSFSAMAHVTADLVHRLEQHCIGRGIEFSFQEALPTKQYFELIEQHHAARTTLAATREVLAEAASQFRALQKRLLVRFKERNPSSLDNLDGLLSQTYDQLLELGSQVEHQQPALEELASRLAAATRLFVLLLRFRFQLDDSNYNCLLCHFSPDCVDNLDQGWEERVSASLLYLLRTSLAKQGKGTRDGSAMVHDAGLLQDVSKLKKHITTVVDRLGKGLRPVPDKSVTSNSNPNPHPNPHPNESMAPGDRSDDQE
eukprot:TRINITY_DN11578_c0_g2_i1.p1 TRINITY_DN11578_c0_g2~~TRINITY_DN11578_c0_g2_i1.p1  ORF type:complete len:700 (-),score=174.65 TRINITY_DN11578_c0_g2_i1:246-2345(-)